MIENLKAMNQNPLTLEQEAQSENTSPERLAELAEMNDHLAYLVAENVNTSPETLRQLTKSNNQEILKAIVRNPNTPTEILISFGSAFPEELGKNPILDLWLFEDIHPLLSYRQFHRKLATNPKTPEQLLTILAKNSDQEIRRLVAENPNTPLSVFEYLVTHCDKKVRCRLAENPHTSPEILTKLAQSQELIKSLSKSQFNSYDTMEYDQALAIKLASHPNTPSPILELLVTQTSPTVQYGYRHNSNLNDIYDNLIFSSSIVNPIRSALVNNMNAPVNVLFILAKDSNDWLRSKVAEHPNTPANLLEILAKDSASNVRGKVAENPNTPVSLLKVLATDSDKTVRSGVINNLNAPASLLEIIKNFSHLF
jgi:hypothetical protein